MTLEDNPIYRLQKAVLDRKRSPFTVRKETETQKFQSALTKDHFMEVLDYTRAIMDQDLETASAYAQFNSICADREKLGEELYNDIQSVRETILKRMRAPREALWEQTTTNEAFEEKMVRLGLNATNTELEIQKAIQHYGSAENYLKDLQSEKNTLSEKGMEIEAAKYEMKIADLYKKTGQFNDSKSHYQSAKNTFEKNKMDIESAICSFKMSLASRSLDDLEDANNHLLSAREIFERQGMGIEYVLCTLEMSSLGLGGAEDLFALDDVLKVKEFFKRSSLNDQVAKCDFILATIYSKFYQYSDAIKHIQSARKSYEEQGMEEDVVKCDHKLGTLYSSVGKYEMALTLLQSAMENFNKRQLEIDVAKCDFDIGNVYKRMGEFAKALARFESARRIYSDKDQKKELAWCDLEIGTIYQLLGDIEHAWQLLNEAKQLFLELQMKIEASKCDLMINNILHQDLNQLKHDFNLLFAKRSAVEQEGGRIALAGWESEIGELYKKYGYPEEAMVHSQISRMIFEEEGLTSKALECDRKMGELALQHLDITDQAFDLSSFDEDIENLEKIRNMYGTDNNFRKAGEFELQIGDRYQEYSQFGKALDHYELARGIFINEGMEEMVAACNLSIGNTYQDLGQFELALKHLELSKKVFQERDNEVNVAICDLNIGNIYEEFSKNEEALELYESALRAFKKKKRMRNWVAKCKHNIALLYKELGRYNEAFSLFRSARKIFKDLGMDAESATCDLNMAILERDSGRYEKALALFEEVYRVYNHVPEIKLKSLWGKSKTHKLLGQSGQAMRILSEGIETAEEMRELITQEEYRSSFLEFMHDIYKEMIELCVDQEDSKKAIEYVEALKSRNLAEMLAGRERVPKNATKEEIDEYRSVYMQLKACSSRLNREREPILISHLQGKKTELEDQYETLVKRFREKDPYYDPHGRVKISYGEIKDLAVDTGSTIIEIFPSEDKTIIFVISGQKDVDPTILIVKDYNKSDLKNHIEGLSTRFYEFQKSKKYREKQQAKMEWERYLDEVLMELYAKLFLKIQPNLEGVVKIVFIPYGRFHLLPLHAMYTEGERQKHYLMDDYLVTYAPSVKILRQCKTIERNRKDKVVVFSANPDTTRRLMFLQDEVKDIMNIFDSAKVIYNATKQNVIEEGKECNIFHFSGHAHFKGLTLHSGNENVSFDDYSVEDIFISLDLPEVYLVTLSACETGRILTEKNIDEYIGLPSAMLHAGAPTVVSSLWCVEDFSTSLLMRKMYQFIKEGKQKGEALSAAQRWLKNSNNKEEHFRMLRLMQNEIKDDYDFDFTRPYHWAGFICSGVS